MLIQRSAILARVDGRFEDYAVLGDDLVIGHPAVAAEYQNMVKKLSVDISMTKSLISNNGSVEFASRFFWKRIDVSPISFGQVFASNNQLATFIGPLVSRLNRGCSLYEVLRWLGVGYRALSRIRIDAFPLSGRLSTRVRRHILVLKSPVGPFPLPWEYWLVLGWSKD